MGGNQRFYSNGAGGFYLAGTNNVVVELNDSVNVGLRIGSAASLSFSAAVGLASDILLTRDAAGILAQVNGTNAKHSASTILLSSNANYERGVFGWTDTANVLTIGTQCGGTGTFLRPVSIVGANLSLFGASGSFGSGTGVIFIANDSADPSSNPTVAVFFTCRRVH